MNHLGLAATFFLIFVNVWGGALGVGWVLRNRWFAWAVSPAVFVTCLFGIETLFDLGSLRWLAVATTGAASFLIWLSMSPCKPAWLSERYLGLLERWRAEFRPGHLAPVAATYGLFMGYGLLWRYAFPSIDGSSEKLSDLSYIASYMAGGRIPVTDAWLYPFPSTHYYGLQFYGASVAGRMFGWPVGLTYNLSFIVLVALVATAFTGAVVLLVRSKWVRVAAVCSFVLGGSGAAGFVHLVYQDPMPWNGNRFIGSKPYDAKPFGVWLQDYAATRSKVEVPGEPFAYTIFLGDYHPPLSSFYLIGLCLMSILLWHRTEQRRFAAMTGVTLTWCVLGNTWLFPLQVFAVLVWIAFQPRQWGRLGIAVGVGAAAVWATAYGFLTPFLAASEQYKTSVKPVGADMHTPALLFAIYLLPQILIFFAALYSKKRWGVVAGLSGIFLLAVTEVIFIDDVYAGLFERFNTTLKWWPWIAACSIFVGAWLADSASRRIVRWLAVVGLVYPCAFGFDIARHWWTCPKSELGMLEGNGFIVRSEASRITLNWLRNEPRGVVVERPNKDSYTNSAALPLFAGHRMWLGWVGHEALWRGYSNDVWQRQDNLNRFYAGDMPDSGEWFRVRGIDYILWYQDADTNEIREKIQPTMQSHYIWKGIFKAPDGREVGYWVVRRD